MSTRLASATSASERIMIQRRFQRSTHTPASGARTMPGSVAARVAVASTVAEWVALVSHHTSANCTSDVPKSDTACPVQKLKKCACQLAARVVAVVLVVICGGLFDKDLHPLTLLFVGHIHDLARGTRFEHFSQRLHLA